MYYVLKFIIDCTEKVCGKMTKKNHNYGIQHVVDYVNSLPFHYDMICIIKIH